MLHIAGKRMKAVLLTAMLLVSLVGSPMLLTTGAKTEQTSQGEIDPGSKRLQGDIPDSFYSDADTLFQSKKVDASANPYTGSVYTHNSAFDNTPIVYGIDVSQFNTITDWNAVKNAGIEFVIVRAAYRAAVSGNLLNDSNYQKNIEGALAAGLKVGLYIYSQAITEEEARQEADYLLQHVGSYTISMPLVLDYEYYSETGPTHGRLWDANLSKAQATAVCKAFCQRISENGYTPMVYANANMLTNHLNAEEISALYPVWMAAYTTKSTYSGTYEFWQYSSKGAVPGITGNVDMNFWYTSDTTKYETRMTVSGVSDMTYTGQALVPSFQVMVDGVLLTEGVDYTYTIENNIEVGTATLRIQGCGKYEGYNKNVTFQIKEAKITGFAVVKTTKNSVSLSWDALPGTAHYEVYRTTAINGTAKLVKTLNSDTTTYTQSKLTSGKEYYYYVKAVSGINGAVYQTERKVARTKNAVTRKVALKKKYTLKASTMSGAGAVVTIPAKTVVKLIADASNKSGSAWYYVSYSKNGKTWYGYMPKTKGTLYRYGKTTTKQVNLRKGAGTKKPLVVVIKKKNTKVTVTGQKKVGKEIWYKVIVKQGRYSYQGYIYGKYIKFY